jgi:signal transduction histidine kinase
MAIPTNNGNSTSIPLNQKGKFSQRNIVNAELAASVSWMIRLRWFAGIGVVVAGLVVEYILRLDAHTSIIIGIGVLILVYNLVLYWLERRSRFRDFSSDWFSKLARWQTGLDWLAMILLIHYTGGIESPVIFFFIFHIIIASIFFSRRSAYTFTILAIALVSSVAFLEYVSILPHHPVQGYIQQPLYKNGLFVSGVLLFFASSSLISAYLVASIHERLRQREQEIMDLTESLQRATIRLQALNDGARIVGSTLELKQVLERLVESTARAMGVRACSIRLLDSSQSQLEAAAVYGLSQTYLNKGPVDACSNPIAREVLAGHVVNIPDVRESPLLQYPEEARREGIRAMLSAPLNGKSGPLGIIRAYAMEPLHFSKEDEAFLSATAAQGSIAIENALAYQTIQQLDNMKSQFVRMVTHELRSPVSVSRSLLRTIVAGYAGDLNPQQRDILERANHRMEFLQSLIDDLLDLAAGKAQIKTNEILERVNVVETLRAVIERYEIPAREKNIQLSNVMNIDQEKLDVMATKDGLDRVINNLVSNAVKYTPPAGRVTVELSVINGEVLLSVSDTGIGIPEESLGHLFEEFYRAPNAKELEQEGTGLGLVIVKDTLAKYGGIISVQSKVNEGTKFTINLPLLTL